MSDDCTITCGELNSPISSKSVIYKGEVLSCIGAEIPDNLESLIKKLDTAICQKLKDIDLLNDFKNVGSGVELYLGKTPSGEEQFSTLSSPDSSVNIVYNETTKEVNIEVDLSTIPQDYLTLEAGDNITIVDGSVANSKLISAVIPAEQYLTLSSTDDSVTLTPNVGGDAIDLSVNFPPETPQETITLESADNSVTITTGTTTDARDLSVNFPTIPEQEQSDVLEADVTSKAYIKNKNANKLITGNVSLQTADNNTVILADATTSSIVITIPSTGLPLDNYFVGIIQKGTNTVTVNGFDIKPSGHQNVIEGEGHQAAVEIISGDAFLMGSLKVI